MSYNYKKNLPPEKRGTSSLRIVIPLKETITEIIIKIYKGSKFPKANIAVALLVMLRINW